MWSFFSFLFNLKSFVNHHQQWKKKSALHKLKHQNLMIFFASKQIYSAHSFRTDPNLSWFVYYHYFSPIFLPVEIWFQIIYKLFKLIIMCLRISRSGPKFLRPSLISMKTNSYTWRIKQPLLRVQLRELFRVSKPTPATTSDLQIQCHSCWNNYSYIQTLSVANEKSLPMLTP
jgi:hypothetical protein